MRRDSQQLECVGDWHTLWSLQVPPKIKSFLWKACRDCLPTRSRLQGKGVHCPATCVVCSTEIENRWHVLLALRLLMFGRDSISGMLWNLCWWNVTLFHPSVLEFAQLFRILSRWHLPWIYGVFGRVEMKSFGTQKMKVQMIFFSGQQLFTKTGIMFNVLRLLCQWRIQMSVALYLGVNHHLAISNAILMHHSSRLLEKLVLVFV